MLHVWNYEYKNTKTVPEDELLESELESELELELPSPSPVRVGAGGGAVFSHSLSSSVRYPRPIAVK